MSVNELSTTQHAAAYSRSFSILPAIGCLAFCAATVYSVISFGFLKGIGVAILAGLVDVAAVRSIASVTLLRRAKSALSDQRAFEELYEGGTIALSILNRETGMRHTLTSQGMEPEPWQAFPFHLSSLDRQLLESLAGAGAA